MANEKLSGMQENKLKAIYGCTTKLLHNKVVVPTLVLRHFPMMHNAPWHWKNSMYIKDGTS